MIVFWVVSALSAAGALLFLLPPLLARREGVRVSRAETNLAIYRDQLRELEADLAAGTLSAEQHRKAQIELEARLIQDVPSHEAAAVPVTPAPGMAIVVGVLAPALAFAVYFAIGNPQVLLPGQGIERGAAHGTTAQDVEAMVGRLAARMRDNPADAEGWALLGRSYSALGRFDDAVKAYASAVAQLPRDSGLLADYADVLAMAQGRRLEGEPARLIERALEADPRNLKALALAGTVEFEKREYAAAIRYWERMLPLVPAGSEGERSVKESIAQARSLQGAAGVPRADKARQGRAE